MKLSQWKLFFHLVIVSMFVTDFSLLSCIYLCKVMIVYPHVLLCVFVPSLPLEDISLLVHGIRCSLPFPWECYFPCPQGARGEFGLIPYSYVSVYYCDFLPLVCHVIEKINWGNGHVKMACVPGCPSSVTSVYGISLTSVKGYKTGPLETLNFLACSHMSDWSVMNWQYIVLPLHDGIKSSSTSSYS